MTQQKRLKVVVVEPGYASYAIEQDILGGYVSEIIVVREDTGYEEKVTMLKDADAVMVREAVVDEDLIGRMDNCRVIVRYGVGVDNIDLQAAKARKIFVANVPQYGADDEVSCHAVAMVLAVARRIVTRDRDVRHGKWGIGDAESICSFRDKGLGIIGFGCIARSFLEKMRPFGFKDIWICHPRLSIQEIGEFGGIKATVEEVCRNSDVISLHAPLTESTTHLISFEEFAMMRPETILVNTGRGALVDEQALVRALTERTIKGAGIDVFEEEPPAPDNPLFKLDNVVVSDHTAWYSDRSLKELQTRAAQEVYRVFSGEQPVSWLNPW